MMAVRNMAAAAGTSTDMVPPIVTENKHRRRRPASGDGFGTGITGFASASEHKSDNARPPLPAAPVCRGTVRMFCRARPQRTGARPCLFLRMSRRSAAKLLTRDEARGIADLTQLTNCRHAAIATPSLAPAAKSSCATGRSETRMTAGRTPVNHICKVGAPLSGPGHKWQCRSITDRAPQKPNSGRDLGYVPNMGRA
jgi:hypothetical protein